MTRRDFLAAAAVAARAAEVELPEAEIAEAYQKAARQNVLAAVNNQIFFGYFSVCADGKGFGRGNTYPSLDGHQLSDALLWLGQEDVVRANFDYVKGFQKPNGLLPIAILPTTREVAHTPVEANGGFYRHWVAGDPLRALGSPTYIQNADVIFRRTQDLEWLRARLGSVNLAGEYLASLTTPQGRVGGAGYYIERPPRIEYDGVSQGYAFDAFERLERLNRRAGDGRAAGRWKELAGRVARNFRREFWRGDHCTEYIHPERGAIDGHGLTDVDWTAIATGIAGREQVAVLWPRLKGEKAFYYGGVPTGIVTRPEAYQEWEMAKGDRHDLGAMGRVWYLEAWARWRMGDGEGLVESLRRVAQVGRENGYYWRERYHPSTDGKPRPAGPNTYCEYPANLIRIVQRFLYGVDFGLDGSVRLAPVAPERFWKAGFGQRLRWRGSELNYRMDTAGVHGTYTGERAQRLLVARRGGGKPVELKLPASKQPYPFQA